MQCWPRLDQITPSCPFQLPASKMVALWMGKAFSWTLEPSCPQLELDLWKMWELCKENPHIITRPTNVNSELIRILGWFFFQGMFCLCPGRGRTFSPKQHRLGGRQEHLAEGSIVLLCAGIQQDSLDFCPNVHLKREHKMPSLHVGINLINLQKSG